MHIIKHSIPTILAFLFMACQGGKPCFMPQDGDLLFCIAGKSDMSQAITESTQSDSALQFDHVALFAHIHGVPSVIEASAENGVVTRDFQDFLSHAKSGLVVKRINGTVDTHAAIHRALSFVGQPYDWYYLPDNNKMYCSELIYCSFIDESGKSLFQARPMNFRDANGELPQFWIDLFQQLDSPVPEGVLGTNPNDMAQSPILHMIHIYSPSGEK